jgi:hypothetical protein
MCHNVDGFGGLVVSMLASTPAEAVGFFLCGENPQNIRPMSQLCSM